MKNYQILAIALLALSSCGLQSSNNTTAQADSTQSAADTAGAKQKLTAAMAVKDTLKAGDSLMIKFVVKNNSADTARFLKWHTPFEPLLSKYLDITDENGNEVSYKGPMAKRMMPPPADSYITLNAYDSLSANIDVLKAYAIDRPGKYSVIYNSSGVSGLTVKQAVTFVYKK